MRFIGPPWGYVRLSNNLNNTAIGRIGGTVRVSVRARLDSAWTPTGRLIMKVGDDGHGYACGYDHEAQQLVFGLKSDTSFVMRAPFAADDEWHDFEFRFDSGVGGLIFIDGLAAPLSLTGGELSASMAVSPSASGSVGAGDGMSPFVPLAELGAGDMWANGAGVNPLGGDIAYLRIERGGDGLRDLEMYFVEGFGAPRDYTNRLTPTLVGPPAWTIVPQPSFLRRWPMQEPGEEFLFGSSLFTDENITPGSPTNTVPVIVNAPGGGKALRCRVFNTTGKHSEWRAVVPFPTARDVYLAFDVYFDGSTMTNGGSPYHNWFHWARFGEHPQSDPAVFLGHYDDDGDGLPGVRMHVSGVSVSNCPNRIPFNEWTRVLIRYRAGRDQLGRLALSDGFAEWGATSFSKDDMHQLRLRARSDGSPGTVYFRNIALGTDAQEVMFGESAPPTTEFCGVLIEDSGCVLLAAENGLVYAIENIGAFDPGDRVWVSGVLDPACQPVCPQTGGCISANSIEPCLSAFGTLVPGPAGCAKFRTIGGAEYFIENHGAFSPPDRVFVTGRLAMSGDLCQPLEELSVLNNSIAPGFAECGQLAIGAEECPVLVTGDGQTYLLQDTGGFAPGARIFVRGRLQLSSQLCGTIVQPAIEANTCQSCSPDLNSDGVVNAADLAILLGAWGQSSVPEDISGDGVVNASDLAQMLGFWS